MSQDEHDVPSAPTEDLPAGLLRPGQMLGDRYRIGEQLGRGGMGEVWHAFDLKLRVEVALKAMREDLFKDEKRRDLLRQEVRAAREVVSPNVCRIFDLIEADGRELVSMEYVDGGTLLDVLRERGPLDLKEAQDIASQFLAGLEAIHKAGLIHRDVKPENIMLTRAGRVVLMDFGLARQEDSGAGTVAGTPAYMAPEQAAGLTVDARADVYSAGVVLAEMVCPEGIKNLQSRQSVWEGIRHEPARVPDSPWAPVLKKAVAKQPDQRYKSAHTLTRALEDVTLRVEGAEDLLPYPGLASFTESDAEYFFGREAEIEQMWRRLEGAHLLAVVGPSGAGKTSFIDAGLVPKAPAGWSIVRCTPGNAATSSLARTMAREMAGDADAVEMAFGIDDPAVAVELFSRWRRRHDQALLVVDQFEELFTQNSADAQRRFADLLGRLPLESDVHVLLSLRDDFLLQCNTHEALRPVFFELTPLAPPLGQALRRALVQPATKCGYRFEDDALVEEMLTEVEGERGALPLLAFAAARLWDKRDRDNGVLTRQAYHDIGGVAGALARHAEATIDRIGDYRLEIVRELFRNLVTAEGTRALREWQELLSVFADSQRKAAEEVLGELIDARLLTSYEVREGDVEPTRRVEIIHESLLANWPRFVGWQTQDADSARLRDQLRQAARTWDEHERSDDLLWTGSAFQEFTLWRERYSGGLSDTEEAFAGAMSALAGRRQRLRRTAVAAVVVAAVTVAAITTGLWRRSVLHEHRAEAQKLVALGQMAIEEHPTAALAHATRSLEQADSEEARLLALEALWEGPTAFIAHDEPSQRIRFSDRGGWIVHSLLEKKDLVLVSRSGQHRLLEPPTAAGEGGSRTFFGRDDDHFLSWKGGNIALWSAPEGRVLASAEPGENLVGFAMAIAGPAEQPRAVAALRNGDRVTVDALHPDGRHEQLGAFHMDFSTGQTAGLCIPRQTAEWIGVVEGNDVSVMSLGPEGLSDRLPLGRHEGRLSAFCVPDPIGRFLITFTRSGQIKLWDPSGDRRPDTVDDMQGFSNCNISRDGDYFLAVDRPSPGQGAASVRVWSVEDLELRLRRRIELDKQKLPPNIDPVGLRIAMPGPLPAFRLWSLAAPDGAEPVLLRRGPAASPSRPEFSSDGRWLATADSSGLTMWPLNRPSPIVLRKDVRVWIASLRFTPDGRSMVIAADNEVTLIPLDGAVPAASHTVFEVDGGFLMDLDLSADGELIAVCMNNDSVWIGKDDGSEPRRLPDARGAFVRFSPDGRHVAVSPYIGAQVVVWDVMTAERVAVLTLPDTRFGGINASLRYAADGRLLTATSKGLLAWDTATGDHEVLVEGDVFGFFTSDDARRVAFATVGEGLFHEVSGCPEFADFDAGVLRALETHGLQVSAGALNRKGDVIATGKRTGEVQVGRVGEAPHLLLGHTGEVTWIEIDPLGRWIASTSQDNTVRLWPLPDLSEPPLHTLPREQLIAKLETLTNIRLVRDPEASTGWRLTHEPFKGWETVPTW